MQAIVYLNENTKYYHSTVKGYRNDDGDWVYLQHPITMTVERLNSTLG